MRRTVIALIGTIGLVGIQSFSLVAVADNAAILEEECGKQLNLGDNGCACIGARAEEVLNGKQQGLVVAMVTKDQAASAALREQMTVDEITGAANFMMEAPQVCATP